MSAGGTIVDRLYYELGIDRSKFDDGITAARKGVDDTTATVLRLQKSLDAAQARLAALKQGGTASAEGLARAQAEADLLASQLGRAQVAAGQAAGALAKTEASAARFAQFGGKAAVLGAGAVGAALLAAANHATDMAAKNEAAIRTIQNLVPGAESAFRRLDAVITNVGIASGRTAEQMQGVAQVIAKAGVAGLDDFENRLRLVTQAADASGGSIEGIAEGLDQVLDVFGLADSEAQRVTVSLYNLAKGKAPLDDLFGALASAAPSIHSLGLNFDDAARALVALLNQGYKIRQAAAELQALSQQGDLGKASLKALAAQAPIATDALNDFAAAAQRTEQSADRASQRLQSTLEARLKDLGRTLLPVKVGLVTVADVLLNLAVNGGNTVGALTDMAVGMHALDTGAQGAAGSVDAATSAIQRFRAAQASAGGVSPTAHGPLSPTQHFAPVPGNAPHANTSQENTDATIAAQKLADATDKATAAEQALIDQLSLAQASLDGPYTRAITQIRQQLADFIDTLDKARAAGLKTNDTLDANGKVIAQGYNTLKANAVAAATALEKLVPLVDRAKSGAFDITPQIVQNTRLDGSIKLLDGMDKELQGMAHDAKAVPIPLEEAVQHALDLQDAIAGTVRSFVDSASAAGLISSELAGMLDRAVATGRAIAGFATELKALKLGVGDPLSTVAAGGNALIGAIGLVSSLFGKSPAQQEQEARNKELVVTLEKLTVAVNDFRTITLTGSKFTSLTTLDPASFSAAVNLLSRQLQQQQGRAQRSQANVDQAVVQTLAQLGLTLDDVKAGADALGISLKDGIPTIQDIVNVAAGLKHLQFAQFAADFGSQLGKLQEQFKLFSTSGKDQFTQLVDFLGGQGAGGIFGALKGIDVSTVEGAKQATDILRGIFENFGSIDSTAFGNLNPTDFFTALDTLFGLIPQAAEAVDPVAQAIADLEERFRALDITDAGDQAEAFLATLAGFSPALKGLVDGLDLSTQEGLHTAEQRLEDFYTKLKSGAIALDTEGGITLDDLLTALDLLHSATTDTVAAIETLSDRLSTLGQDTDALNLDAVHTLIYTIGHLGDFAPELQGILSQFDLSTLDGLQAADAALGQFFLTVTDPELRNNILNLQHEIRAAYSQLSTAADQAAADLKAALDQAARDNAQAAQDYIDQLNAQTQAAKDAAQAAADLAKAESDARHATADRAVQQLKNQFDLFDITDAIAQLQQTAAVLSAGSPFFADLTKGLDLSTGQGRADLLRKLQEAFLQNPQGVESGFFSSDQTLQQLLALAQLTKSAGTADITGGTSTSFAIDRSITVAQGSQILGTLGTANVFLGEIADSTAAVVAMLATVLGPATLGAVEAPSIPTSGGVGTLVLMISNLTIDGTTVDPASGLSPATQANIRAIADALANELLLQQRGG